MFTKGYKMDEQLTTRHRNQRSSTSYIKEAALYVMTTGNVMCVLQQLGGEWHVVILAA